MRYLKRNKFEASSSPIARLESRVMLSSTGAAATTGLLTRAITENNMYFPEDGFGRFSSVGTTGVAALNNAWNQNAFRRDEELLGRVSVNKGRARVTVARSPGRTLNTGEPFGFPALLVGSSNGITSDENPFTEDGLRADQIGQIPFTFVSNGGANDGVYNTTLDIWFGQERRNGVDAASGLLMLQSYNSSVESGKLGTGQPAGTLRASNVRIPNFPGRYDIWFGDNAGSAGEGGVSTPTVSYIRRDQPANNIQRTSGDLNLLIKDAQSRGYLETGLNLHNVFAGAEIWGEGVGTFAELEIDVVPPRAPSSGGGRSARR